VHLLNALSTINPFRALLSVIAALATIGIVPFTVFVLQGTNEALFALERREMEKERDGAAVGVEKEKEKETIALIREWARLNRVRAAFPCVGALVAGFCCYNLEAEQMEADVWWADAVTRLLL